MNVSAGIWCVTADKTVKTEVMNSVEVRDIVLGQRSDVPVLGHICVYQLD